MRGAAIASFVLGLGFGLPGVYGTWHLATRHQVADVFGFPTYGNGPFERIGVHSSTGLLAAYVLVCGGEIVAGVLLWRGRRSGVVSSIALLPLELAFWVGFALPFGPPLGIIRTALVVGAWHKVMNLDRAQSAD